MEGTGSAEAVVSEAISELSSSLLFSPATPLTACNGVTEVGVASEPLPLFMTIEAQDFGLWSVMVPPVLLVTV